LLESEVRFNTTKKTVLKVEALSVIISQVWVIFIVYKSFPAGVILDFYTFLVLPLNLIGFIGFFQLVIAVFNQTVLKNPVSTFLMLGIGCTSSIWFSYGGILNLNIWNLVWLIFPLVSGHFCWFYLNSSSMDKDQILQYQLVEKIESQIEKFDKTKQHFFEKAKAWSPPIVSIGIIALALKLFEIYGYFGFKANREESLQLFANINAIILFGYFLAIAAVWGKVSKLKVAFGIFAMILILVLTAFFEAVKAH